MAYNEIIINKEYPGLNPVQFGYETCAPRHSFGPAVRTHMLLHYVKKGQGIFKVGQKTYTVTAGQIFVIFPFEKTYYEADPSRPWEYIWVGFTAPPAITSLFKEPVISLPGAGELFEKMKECRHYEGGKNTFLSGLLWQLVALLEEGTRPKDDYVEKALSILHANYSSSLSVSEIASRLNLDRSYFSTLFKKQVGLPPATYLRIYRLEKAAELMRVHHKKPAIAAVSVGFDDLFHFSKVFKDHFGVSPREYSKEEI